MAQSVLSAIARLEQSVVDPGKGVCADPVNGGAILGKGGTGPQRWEQRASVEPGQGKG